VHISGHNVVNQEAHITSSNTQITGNQVNKQAENTNISVGGELGGSKSIKNTQEQFNGFGQ